MKRFFLHLLIIFGIISASAVSQAQNSETIVNVTAGDGEALPGIVLLVHPGNFLYSKTFITDIHGKSSIPHFDCSVCVVTAYDSKHLFYDKSIEFDSKSSSIDLMLRLRPGIDRIGIPDSVRVNLILNGSNSKPLPNQNIIIRPKIVALGVDNDYNRVIIDTTDSNGSVTDELVPGKYIVATLVDGKPFESEIEIYKSKIHCKPKAKNCWNPSFRSHPPTQNVEAHLSAVEPYSE
jgi:hypothetical protein